MTSRNKYILPVCLQYMNMAWNQIFISKLVQLLGLVFTGLEKKKANKKNPKNNRAKSKQNKTKQNKAKQKQKNKKKTTTKQFDHFIFKICQNQYFTIV